MIEKDLKQALLYLRLTKGKVRWIKSIHRQFVFVFKSKQCVNKKKLAITHAKNRDTKDVLKIKITKINKINNNDTEGENEEKFLSKMKHIKRNVFPTDEF